LLLNSSFEDGTCYIQTSSLDGEKNLKKRKMPKELDKIIQPGNKQTDQLIFIGESECEAPSADLYTFVGKLMIGGITFPLNVDQLLLKGTNLKNTEWCIAFCVFTGNDTRLMINSQSVRVKLSALEKKLNYFVIWILVIQVIVCITTSFMETKWNLRGSQID
jgi:magnesium-transporting ATPase (P-type)